MRSSDQMRSEHDFSKGVCGKHAARYAAGSNVVVSAPDVASQFQTADDVSETLRAVAKLAERRKKRQTAQNHAANKSAGCVGKRAQHVRTALPN